MVKKCKLTKTAILDPDPVLVPKTIKKLKKQQENDKAAEEASSLLISPDLGTRLDLHVIPDSTPGAKYTAPRTKKQQQIIDQRHRDYIEYLNFCPKNVKKMPDPPTPIQTTPIKLAVPSAEIKEAKVMPQKASITHSALYPPPQRRSHLKLKAPKSGTFINVTKKMQKKKRRRRKMKKQEPPPIEETETFYEMLKEELATIAEMMGEGGEMGGEGGDYIPQQEETKLTKQFRRKVSQISKTTSYKSGDYVVEQLEGEGEGEEEEMVGVEERFVQKFYKDADEEKYKPKKPTKPKKHTLENFSLTKLVQPTLKQFYYGIKQGTIHQGDGHFPEDVRNHQNICIPIAAYCYTLLKHPTKWLEQDIDDILEYGTKLYLECLSKNHLHHHQDQNLDLNFLTKYCHVLNQKIRFEVSEADVVGMIRSEEKHVANLTKGLTIFFNRFKNTKTFGAVLETENQYYLIWKDKFYYFFDANPRTIDLCRNLQEGVAILANFYDLKSVLTVLLDRTGLRNSPFAIYTLKAFKILKKDHIEQDSKHIINEMESYRILDEERAVVLGSFDLADKCFGFSRNKQSLTIAIIALVYSKITPSSCWYKLTIDKIMIIGNQLFLECIRNDQIDQIGLNDLPAIFTIGPYICEIYIYPNQKVDLLYKKQKCMLKQKLEEFFETNTNAILEINDAFIAIWKQRSMYHYFDPYSRNLEGLKCRNGTACTTMFTNLETMAKQLEINFATKKDLIFGIHSLKVIKIHRDPDYKHLFPKGMQMKDYPTENFKKIKMKKFGKTKLATTKPVTIDKTLNATIYSEIPEDSSLYEVGSNVKSLQMEEIPKMVEKFPSKSFLKEMSTTAKELIVDLDSPSLSDTQIDPIPIEEQTGGFIDLDDFYLTLEESELLQRGEEGQENESSQKSKQLENEAEIEEELGGIEDGEDFYYTQTDFTQIHSGSFLSRISRGDNTDIDNFELTYEVLPSLLPIRQIPYRNNNNNLQTLFEITEEPELTLSQELKIETNFIPLLDGSQIIHGTKNLINFTEDLEFTSPFVCIMSCAVAKKYSIRTWSQDVIDYILKCGTDLYKKSTIRYDQVYTMEIPRVKLGRTDFSLKIDYFYDSILTQKNLELCLKKLFIFNKNCCGIMATPTYSISIFKKQNFYYLFDCFGCNEIGLGKGQTNDGQACLIRYQNLTDLTHRIIHNKKKREENEHLEYNRFVLSCCIAKSIPKEIFDEEEEEEENEDLYQGGEDGDDFEVIRHKTPKIPPEPEKAKVGYQPINNLYKIEGTRIVGDGKNENSSELKEDFFVCLSAALLLLNTPLKKWDAKKIDMVIERGLEIYQNLDDSSSNNKKYIENVLMDDYIFNLVTRKINLTTFKQNRTLQTGIETILSKKHETFLILFPNRCFTLSLDQNKNIWHLFDPNRSDLNEKTSWTQYRNTKLLLKRIRKSLPKKRGTTFDFFTFDITSIKKAPKYILLKNKLNHYKLLREEKKELLTRKPFHEQLEWLELDPIPWSKKLNKSELDKWNWWFIEIAKKPELYSLFGTLSVLDSRFLQKQMLGICTIAIIMTQIYSLCDWSEAIMDSILICGDAYFRESIDGIQEENYELTIEDLKNLVTVFPYQVKIKFTPIVEGTMFLLRLKQFNLYKALRFFFDDYDSRYGIICVSMSENDKRQYAFGKLKPNEYFLYDCCTLGQPMFENENSSVPYILRTTTLNRLVHVMTLTLRGGDFYIYDVGLSELEPLPMS